MKGLFQRTKILEKLKKQVYHGGWWGIDCHDLLNLKVGFVELPFAGNHGFREAFEGQGERENHSRITSR